MDLIKLLTEQLGITDAQAKGGAGLIFDLVKKHVSGDEFQQVTKAVPQVQVWMSAAPQEAGGGGLWGLAGSLAGQLGLGDLGKLAELASGFQKLNLDPGMLAKFAPIVMKFVESLGGDQLKAILAKVLAAK
jgi:hypothetical protein